MNAVDKGLLSKSLITSTHLNSSFNSLIHERVEWYYLPNCIVVVKKVGLVLIIVDYLDNRNSIMLVFLVEFMEVGNRTTVKVGTSMGLPWGQVSKS